MIKYFIVSIFVFFSTSIFGQSFSLPELVRMSKMNVESFDSYVTSRGYVFLEQEKDEYVEGVNYGLNPDTSDKSRATKFITLHSIYYNFKYHIYYQTSNKSEYVRIKEQIKSLGFKLM